MTDALSGVGPDALADPIREDYLTAYQGNRMAESMRYVRSYPAELPVLACLLPRIDTPVQIIAGSRDTAVPLVNAEFLHQRLPHSRLDVIDAGHFTWEDAPDQYAALVTSWWAGAPRPEHRGNEYPCTAATGRTRSRSPPRTVSSPAAGCTACAGECQTLDRLAANARSGHSQVLVLRGEPGIGKTALLDYLAGCAACCRIARVAGAEPETELALAGLHQLCAPFLDRLGQLPGPQRDALRTAFSMRDGNLPDRFAVGLATLSLLAEVAAERPLICVIDDAHWLDRASAQVLGFVARHLAGRCRSPWSSRCASPTVSRTWRAAGAGGRRADRSATRGAAALGRYRPAGRAGARPDRRRDPGNPLALLRCSPRCRRPRWRRVRPAGTRPLNPRVEESYRRLRSAAARHPLLLLIAAAELAGDPVTVWRAAGHLASSPGPRPATAAGSSSSAAGAVLSPVGPAAIYQAASPRQRHYVHRALAQATDPEVNPHRRAWHRHATPGLDEDVAAGLERAARHASPRALAAAAVLANAPPSSPPARPAGVPARCTRRGPP